MVRTKVEFGLRREPYLIECAHRCQCCWVSHWCNCVVLLRGQVQSKSHHSRWSSSSHIGRRVMCWVCQYRHVHCGPYHQWPRHRNSCCNHPDLSGRGQHTRVSRVYGVHACQSCPVQSTPPQTNIPLRVSCSQLAILFRPGSASAYPS